MRLAVVLLLSLSAAPLFAQNCSTVLGKQSPDAASLRHVEAEWNRAFTQGDANYLQCLLSADYASVSPKGVHGKDWELEHARKNHGSTAAVPTVPGETYEVHGATGIMRLLKPASADSKFPAQYMADVFAFQDGAWRAVYSQHTDVAEAK